MKDLKKIIEECFAILDDLQIPYDKNVTIKYNGRITKKWGYCRKLKLGFEISIAKVLGYSDTPDKTIKSVLLHELLHTCPDCFNHGKQWKKYAKLIKKRYNIKISTTSNAEDMGINPHYYIKCRKCDVKAWYPMKPRNMEQRCPVCNSKKLSCFYKNKGIKELIWKR